MNSDLEKTLRDAKCYRVIGMFMSGEWFVQLRQLDADFVSATAPTLLAALTQAVARIDSGNKKED